MTREEKAKQAQEAAKRAEVAAWIERSFTLIDEDPVMMKLRRNGKGDITLQIGEMVYSDHTQQEYFNTKLEVTLPAASTFMEVLLGAIEEPNG